MTRLLPLLFLVLGLLAGCGRREPAHILPAPRRPLVLTLLHTGDEHGWLQAGVQSEGLLGGGAAEMTGLWRRNDGYPTESMIVLSSGDMWIGPALSTWSKGQAAVEIMNAMGYRAAALGNHDFGFGPQVLRERRAASKFPYLAANVTPSDAYGNAIESYRVVDVAGVSLGIVGLALRETPLHTATENLAGLVFHHYAETLRRVVPEVRQQAAELVIVLAHECAGPLRELGRQVEDLGIVAMLGGHCHEQRLERVGQTWIVESGARWSAYSRLDIELDPRSRAVQNVRVKLLRNAWQPSSGPAVAPDPTLRALVNQWSARAEKVLGEVIGYTKTGLSRPGPLHELVTRAWLWNLPEVDIAFSNPGGFRQDVGPGDITTGDIVGVLPFENHLVRLTLSGAQVKEALTSCGAMAIGGIGAVDGQWRVTKTGQSLEPSRTYQVLINSFMYTGSSCPFNRLDPRARDTQVHWRQPVIDWIRAQRSSPEAPLEQLLDSE